MRCGALALVLALPLLVAGCKKASNSGKTGKGKEVAAATPAPAPVSAATPTAAIPVDRNAKVIVLCYHRFEDKPRDSLAISPAEFKSQMQALKDSGIAVIPMKDFLAWRRSEKSIPLKSCVITVDDGYISGYTVAWPILKEYGYPFTMFIYTNYVGAGGKSMT